jgi:iron complex transport system substrate-binding protein
VRFFFLLISCLVAVPVQAVDPPLRVVSINLCSDQLLLMLAKPEQIASVSRLSLEPNSSFMAASAANYPVNDAMIEQLLSLNPDLVLASEFSPHPVIRILRHLGYRVETLPLSSSLEDIRRNIRYTAGLLGADERGERLVAEMDRRLQHVASTTPQARPPALFYQPRGYTSGLETLQHEALMLAGWRNLSAEHGIRGYGAIDLETLLLAKPQQLFSSTYAPGTDSLAQRQMHHPALNWITQGRPIINIPYKYWICGGPMIADAVEALAKAHPETSQYESGNKNR